ncbi:SDR family NAD(P)-dependent oxidoreductase [Litorimonas sp. RW-G-Af-16]|uniref:SDR family NAD(P)-dependent oxidoreductase n=1 Tax=Litorimonas sp. RW-G-Af-16 TaxID=3241168 RepID=UPI00390C89A4
MKFDSLGHDLRAAIIGATGGIGHALVEELVASDQVSQIYALSRSGQSHPSAKVANLTFDLTSESSIQAAAEALREVGAFDIIIVATGLLQGQGIAPEKNMRAMSFENFEQSFAVNTFGPAVTAKHFLPLMRRDGKAVFAALSARVGSISDNRIGGWYAYRASKAALNMILKCLSIEYGRRFKDTIIIGLHPGTVDTSLSQPFQGNVPEDKLFTPQFSAQKLLSVVDQVKPDDSGELFDWAGKRVQP